MAKGEQADKNAFLFSGRLAYWHRFGGRFFAVRQQAIFYLEDRCPLGPVSAHEWSTELNIETTFPLMAISLAVLRTSYASRFFTARRAVW